jgi:osmotically-inducible protein OsmY
MTKPFFKHLLLIFSLVLLTACAGGKTYESTGEYLDDVVIANKVRASIIGDSTLKFFQISVECYRGVVQLSGFVDSPKAIARAAQLARTVAGVRMVNNSLLVKEQKK